MLQNKPLRTISLFSGVGGIDLAFESSQFNIIYANDIDKYACETFNKNFKLKAVCKDIREISSNKIPECDCLIAGFPCQAFSIAGYKKGFNDTRGTLFFEVARVIKDKKPKVVFLENVKNLVSHDQGRTFTTIIKTLENLGYYTRYKVLNACEYGNIPQNRERIYIVGFLDKNKCDKFYFPNPIPLTTKLNQLIDFNHKVNDKFYYTRQHYPKIVHAMQQFNNAKTIYQWRRQYVRQNKSNLCPTLTANMGTGGHNVPIIITKYGYRKLTPQECFRLQGFPKNFVLPNISSAQLYKQAGNSVCVTVIQRIAQNIHKCIK